MRCLLPFMVAGLLLCAGSAVADPGLARSMYCNSQLIRSGDAIWQVARRCPQAYWVNRWNELAIIGGTRWAPAYRSVTVEVWYINFGPRRFLRRLIFHNGYLYRIESLGYGVAWLPGTRLCTPSQLQHAGDTTGEIWARCGEPDHRYAFPQHYRDYYSGPWLPPTQFHREIWTYEFDGRIAPRELTFDNGRLVRLRTLRR